MKLTMQDKAEIVRLHATTNLTNKQIAEMFNVSNVTIGNVIKSSSELLEQAERDSIAFALRTITADNAYDQEWRMRERMRDMLKLDTVFTADAVNARERIRNDIAKELGQVAPSHAVVTGSVSHIIGIDNTRWVSSLESESPVEVMKANEDPALTRGLIPEIEAAVVVDATVIDSGIDD